MDIWTDAFYHYGIKGMKWGVRRTPEQLGHRRAKAAKTIRTKNGLSIKATSIHATQRTKERSVDSESIADALKNPLHISDVRVDDLNRKGQRFVGKSATVNVNPETGVITTVWRTGRHTLKKYMKKGD